MMTRTVLGELLHKLPISYGGEVGALGAAKIVELFERELEDLILKEKAQIMRAFEDGRRLGEVCTSEAYYTLKFERR
jgi:hypothetical protein